MTGLGIRPVTLDRETETERRAGSPPAHQALRELHAIRDDGWQVMLSDLESRTEAVQLLAIGGDRGRRRGTKKRR